MTELDSLKNRKQELAWSMLLLTPQSFSTPGARGGRRELGRVTSRINAIMGEA